MKSFKDSVRRLENNRKRVLLQCSSVDKKDVLRSYIRTYA